MSKGNIIFAGSMLVSAAALAVAGYTYYTFAHQPMTLPAIEAPTTSAVSEATPEEATPVTASASFDISDGKLVFNSGALALKHDDQYVSIQLPETASNVEYYEDQGYLSWSEDGGQITVSTISASDIDSNYAHDFDNDDGKLIIAAKQITDTTGINVVANISDRDNADSIKETTNSVCDSVAVCDGMHTDVCGLIVNPGWTVSLAKDVICLTNGEERITASAFTNSIDGAGFSNSVEIGDKSLKSGSYKDADTNYSPYMYDTNNGLLKVMATSQDILTNAFS